MAPQDPTWGKGSKTGWVGLRRVEMRAAARAKAWRLEGRVKVNFLSRLCSLNCMDKPVTREMRSSKCTERACEAPSVRVFSGHSLFHSPAGALAKATGRGGGGGGYCQKWCETERDLLSAYRTAPPGPSELSGLRSEDREEMLSLQAAEEAREAGPLCLSALTGLLLRSLNSSACISPFAPV